MEGKQNAVVARVGVVEHEGETTDGRPRVSPLGGEPDWPLAPRSGVGVLSLHAEFSE